MNEKRESYCNAPKVPRGARVLLSEKYGVSCQYIWLILTGQRVFDKKMELMIDIEKLNNVENQISEQKKLIKARCSNEIEEVVKTRNSRMREVLGLK
ncbi:hypothetical protein K4L44_05955 [Halosquirtibacter laminarini]|uniref:Uncharacterized protein n=1 Tax=Halosquirtibacter laminarini TaxID=3374600 RepID=A0AC61NM42_9BACT|nr:hypothetical protein K4L44_05955 [Prolixibacteraceae bacterium]